MTSRHLHRALVGALLLTLSCAAMAHSDDSPGTKSPIDTKDSAFLQHAAADGAAEVQIGQMALDKSSDAQVKQLAQRIVDDHTKANDQLKTLAQNKQVTLPTTISANTQKETRDLQTKNGSAFDQAWSKAMVKNHQAAVKLFTQENAQTKDTDLRQFTQAMLPTLHAHLQLAQKLAAVPDARDKAMDQTTKSMANDPMNNMPATTAPTVAPPTGPAPAAGTKH